MSYRVIKHPLVSHKLTMLRDKQTGPRDFRSLIEELSSILAYEASRSFSVDKIAIETPFEKTEGSTLSGKKLGVVAILRAGLAMVSGVLQQFPNAKVGHFGLYRDEKTLIPVQYYLRYLDKLDLRNLFILDPMLATGGTAIEAINLLKQRGAQNITILNIVASKKGVDNLLSKHQDVKGYTCAIDPILSDQGYIMPGLGDAGDRIFGTV